MSIKDRILNFLISLLDPPKNEDIKVDSSMLKQSYLISKVMKDDDAIKSGNDNDPYSGARARIKEMLSSNEEDRKEALLALGKDFLETAAWGDDRKIQVFVDEGFPVNYQDPKTGSTALHRAASCMARDVIRVLIKEGDCDFLIRDNKGRLSSEMAYIYGRDPALARLLGIKERKQAAAQGIKLTHRPLPEHQL